jgi:hypothetical protein
MYWNVFKVSRSEEAELHIKIDVKMSSILKNFKC